MSLKAHIAELCNKCSLLASKTKGFQVFSERIKQLHHTAQVLEASGAWVLAGFYRNLIAEILKAGG